LGIKYVTMKHSYLAIVFFVLLGNFTSNAQQDPQYTQYMYNTQVVNPAYAGNRDVLSFGLLYRTQWVSLEGAPQTGTFTINSPVGSLDNMGLGLSIVRDELGPSVESNITVDFSYSITTSDVGEISFGVKGGLDILDVDYSKLDIFDGSDPLFQNNVDNKVQPQIGAGVYYNTNKFYAGLSVPNFINSKHFDESSIDGDVNSSSIAVERLHYFLIAGYVFDLSEDVKFKPAFLG